MFELDKPMLHISIHLEQFLKSYLKMSKRKASEESAELNEDPASQENFIQFNTSLNC